MPRHISPKMLLPLVLFAVLVIAAALIAALAGDAANGPDGRTDRRRQPQQNTARRSPAPVTRPQIDIPEALAVRYALIARNWTPATYRASWHRQIVLATGAQRHELASTLPRRADVNAVRQDHASSRAALAGLRRDTRVRVPRARVLVVLRETTTAAGQTVTGRTVNDVMLRRIRVGWRVAGFTIVPGASG